MITNEQISAIGSRLRNARKSAGLSIRRASEAAMVCGDSIRRIERGRTLGCTYTVLSLCEVYGCDPAEIFSGTFDKD